MPIISNDDHKVDRVFFAQTKRTKPRSKTASARFAERPILARILAHRATCSVAVAIVIVSAVLPFPCCTESKTWAVTVAAPQEDDPKAVLLEEVASNAQNAGDYEVAAAKWQELIDDYPEFERIGFALLESGKCNIELLQFENAIEHLKAANRQLPETAKVGLPKSLLYLGFAQYRLGQNLLDSNPQKANRLLTTATKSLETGIKTYESYPDTDQACYFQGSAFELLERLQDAANSYEKMFEVKETPHFNFDGRFALGNVYEQLGQYEKALAQYQLYLDTGSDQPDFQQVQFRAAVTMTEMANAAREIGDNENYATTLKEARTLFGELAEDDAFVLKNESGFQRAVCSHWLGEYKLAAQQFEVVANTNSDDADNASILAGRDYLRVKEFDKATKYLQQTIDTSDKFASEAAYYLAELKLQQDNPRDAYELASTWIEKGEAAEPFVAELMQKKADAAFLLDNLRKESPALYMQIAEQFPDHRLVPTAIYNAAFSHLEIEQYQEALKVSKNFEKRFPEDPNLPDVLEVRADALLLLDKLPKSRDVYDRLINTFVENPKRPRWQVRAGLVRYLNKEYEATIAGLSPIVDDLQETGLRAEALHWIGNSQLANENFTEAETALARSLETEPDWRLAAETMLALSQAQTKLDKKDAAAKTLAQLKAAFPDALQNADATYRMAEQAYADGQYETAIKHHRDILSNYGTSEFVPFSLSGIGWSHLQLKQFADANTAFTTLIDEHPKTELAPQAYLGRGMSRRQAGDLSPAITDLETFITEQPDDPQIIEARYELALAKTESDENDQAIKMFETLVADAPKHRFADRFHYELAWLYQGKEDSDRAFARFTTIATDFPDSDLAAEANFQIGETDYRAKEYERAAKAFLICRDSEGENALREKAAYRLGWCHYRLKQYEMAQQAFQQQVADFEEGAYHAEALVMIGESFFNQNQMQEAYEAYTVAKPAIDAAGNVSKRNDWLTMLHGAAAANKTDQFEAAIEFLNPLLESEAENEFKLEGWFEKGVAQRGLDQTDNAIQSFGRAADSLGQIGAKARCMIGDVLFTQQKFDEAIDAYKDVFYGYGGTRENPDIDPWQAYAIYHAARCSFVRISTAEENLKPKLISDSQKLYENLLANYAGDELAPQAEKDLQTLQQLQRN